MFKSLLAAAALCALSQAACGADLTALEQRWLGAASPVIAYARGLQLPMPMARTVTTR